MTKTERQTDLLKIIEQLDISPTMYKNAVSKYDALATYLQTHGINAEIYPQGSFALGTVVRPVAKNPDAAYDLDAICQVSGTREDMKPSELWDRVKEILTSSDLYGGKLTEHEKCFTIEYAEIGGCGFSIDIVPAADESQANKDRLRAKSPLPLLVDTSISIPNHVENSYQWITNNPKGYRTWFEKINAPFAAHAWEFRSSEIMKAHPTVFASVEEIPQELNRSALQRVIQILKHHRDVYYGKLQNGDDIKPISAIINTIVAKIAESARADITTFELLKLVTDELYIYSRHQFISKKLFTDYYGTRSVIAREDDCWMIENPANPEDNLADAWNENPAIPKQFFLWADSVKKDLIESTGLGAADFRARAETAFGPAIIAKNWGAKYNPSLAKPILGEHPAKPWRVL